MPFGEALQQMPLYSKFLKDMLTRKHRYIHQANIIVEENCSAVIQKDPMKKSDIWTNCIQPHMRCHVKE